MFTYVVREDEVAVVRRIGNIQKIIINEDDMDIVKANHEVNSTTDITISTHKGLNFKIPFVNTVQKYPAKYLTYTSNQEQINTVDERLLVIQIYSQYRIVDPAKFAIVVKRIDNANGRMDELVYPAVIGAANSLTFEEFFLKDVITELLNSKKEELNEVLLQNFGLYAVDVGIHRKNFPEQNKQSIESKMSKQIEKESEKLIAEGDAEYQMRKAKTDREKAEVIAGAIEEAAVIKASADAEAARIYQESLQKDLEFYQFIKRMELYKNLNGSTIFMDDDNSLLKYLDEDNEQ